MEFDCENMTVFGCPARDTAKNLMLHELMEGSDTHMELKDICKKQCSFCGGHAIFKTISLGHNSFSVGFKFKIECEECAVSLPKIYEINLSLTDDGSINDLNIVDFVHNEIIRRKRTIFQLIDSSIIIIQHTLFE